MLPQASSTPLGSLLLSEVLNIGTYFDTAFTIQCQYRNYECFAPTQRDRDGWVEAINGAAERVAELEQAKVAQNADPLGLLDELVTVVEPSFTQHVDSVTSAYASLRESLMMTHQRAAVKAAGLEAARDDVDAMRLKIKQLEAARLEAEARATTAEDIANQQHGQLSKLNDKLRTVTAGAVGLQCVVDQSRAQLSELRRLVADEGPEEEADIEASRVACVNNVWTFVDTIEKIASEQYDRTAEIASEQADEAQQRALESRIAHIDSLRLTAATERIRKLAQRKFGWRRVNTEDMDWEALWESRQSRVKARFILEESGEVKADVMGTDGGKECLDVSEEEKAAADKLKKERSREAAKEKLRAMKEKKRIERAEKAAREAAEAAEREAERAAEEPAATEPNSFLDSLMADDPAPDPAESSESEEVRCV